MCKILLEEMTVTQKVMKFPAYLEPKGLMPCSYKGASKSFWNGHPEWELQMVQFSDTQCSCIAILWVSLVSSATITLCVASQHLNKCPLLLFISLLTQSRNFWIHPH